MRRSFAILATTLLGILALPAQAAGPSPGEYVCTKMKGTLLPCTPRHLFILEGKRWTWGPKQKGTYKLHGRKIEFEGKPHGPVAWGAAHFEGDSIMFVDKKVTAIFSLQKTAR